jgi:hypothetical protein
VNGLPRAVELLSGQPNDVAWMGVNVLDDELADGLAAHADLAHVLSTILTWIVNHVMAIVNFLGDANPSLKPTRYRKTV